ncbi:unnamed protein product, partial [Allacma fusca]
SPKSRIICVSSSMLYYAKKNDL